MTVFVKGIEDPDFEAVKQLLKNYLFETDHNDRTMDMKKSMDMVESQQRDFNRVSDQDMEIKSRQA
eukprot:10144287-Ditylum_brightwellii.AAC.1